MPTFVRNCPYRVRTLYAYDARGRRATVARVTADKAQTTTKTQTKTNNKTNTINFSKHYDQKAFRLI